MMIGYKNLTKNPRENNSLAPPYLGEALMRGALVHFIGFQISGERVNGYACLFNANNGEETLTFFRPTR
jgi:hypothetical protein